MTDCVNLLSEIVLRRRSSRTLNRVYKIELLIRNMPREAFLRFFHRVGRCVRVWTEKGSPDVIYLFVPRAEDKKKISLILTRWFGRAQYRFEPI